MRTSRQKLSRTDRERSFQLMTLVPLRYCQQSLVHLKQKAAKGAMGCRFLFAQRGHARTELSNREVERCKRGCKHYPASTGEEVATDVW